jgi:phosphomevalonate kinase
MPHLIAISTLYHSVWLGVVVDVRERHIVPKQLLTPYYLMMTMMSQGSSESPMAGFLVIQFYKNSTRPVR